ncbi:MAG: hypothetical protein GPJ52_02755 [Candidatus Heimdallarchaeota archaeon]|nr:hypothetical protein [Candidatus Heimdallarchaeota archaeon]
MSENEIEAMKEFGGEELYQKYLQFLKDYEAIEQQLKKLPKTMYNESSILSIQLRVLELNFGFDFILALLLRSNIFNEDQRKNIESFKGDKRFFT